MAITATKRGISDRLSVDAMWYPLAMTSTVHGRLIEALAECLTIDAARKIVTLRADDASQQYIDELADKANQGTLTEDEKSEYDRCLAVFHFIAVMQAKARRILRHDDTV